MTQAHVSSIHQLEMLKTSLYKLFEDKKSFTHPSVVEISQEMDHLIVDMQKEKMTNARRFA